MQLIATMVTCTEVCLSLVAFSSPPNSAECCQANVVWSDQENESYAATLHCIAQVHSQQGESDKALDIFQQALAIKERTLGKNNESYASTLHGMLEVHKMRGDPVQALAVSQQLVAMERRPDGGDEDFDRYATTLATIAQAAYTKGDLKYALELYQQALLLWEYHSGNRHTCLEVVLRLLRNTPATRIVSDRLVGFVRAKLQYRIDVSDRELCLGFSHGSASLAQQLLDCNSLRAGNSLLLLGREVVLQCLKSAAHNEDSAARMTTLVWLRSNSMRPCTEGLLLALSCGAEDLAREWMDRAVVVTQECVTMAQSHALPEVASALAERLAATSKGKVNSFLQGTVAAAPQSGKKGGSAKKGQKKK